jgi:putative membrane protein
VSRAERLIRVFAAVCGVVWVWAAISPVDRQTWALENLLLVFFALGLFLARRHRPFSSASHGFIFAFFILHIIGAHYTYSRMPLGLWGEHLFHLARNPYDRVTHFAFGFLLVFPAREVLLRYSGIRQSSGYWLATCLILAMSGIFEIIESIVAEMVAPGAGVVWLGGQGDPWDAQNDMLMALAGAALLMALVAMWERLRKTQR